MGRAGVDLGAYEVGGLEVTPAPNNMTDWQWLRYLPQYVQNGDVVTIPDGTYVLSGPINFQGKAFTLRSANGPEKCILQGSLYSQGFHFMNGEGPGSVLSGLTIRGCVHNQGKGGGIWCIGASPTIVNCHITDNNPWMASHSGGGIHLENGSCPLISDCVISRNSGTGIYCDSSTPKIQNCTIASHPDGGIVVTGNVDVTVINCLIVGNGKYNNGGGGITVGPSLDDFSSLTCINCTITGNSGGDAGGLGTWRGKWTLINTLVWGNSGGLARGRYVALQRRSLQLLWLPDQRSGSEVPQSGRRRLSPAGRVSLFQCRDSYARLVDASFCSARYGSGGQSADSVWGRRYRRL